MTENVFHVIWETKSYFLRKKNVQLPQYFSIKKTIDTGQGSSRTITEKTKEKMGKIGIFSKVKPAKDALLLAVLIISTLLSGLVPSVTSILTGRVFQMLTYLTTDIPNLEAYKQLTIRSMSILILAAACFPVMSCSMTFWMLLGERQGLRLRRQLLGSYINRSMAWYDGNENLLGDFTQNNRCVEELRCSSAEASAVIFQNVVAMFSLIGVSFYYSWSLTLIIICTSPVILASAFYISRLVNKYASLENAESSIASRTLMQLMNFPQIIKAYGSEVIEAQKFRESTLQCNRYFIRSCLYASTNTSVIRFLSLCMYVQGFWYSNIMIKRGKLNISHVITCFHACLMLGAVLHTTLHQIIYLQKGDVAIKRIQKFVDEDFNDNCTVEGLFEDRINGIKTYDISSPLPTNYSIIFKNVSFNYPTNHKQSVLRNVSLNFPQGKLTFIVGKSGSGKSTIFELLLRFYSPIEGEILVGNKPHSSSVSQNWIFENITYVTQRCTLFKDTIRNNILLAIPDSVRKTLSRETLDQRLQQACKFALVYDLVSDKLPQGLDTAISPGGSSLSGGQQQLIALARAFLRDTPILVLDESLSAVSVAHRIVLMNRIRKWREGKTTIILTHDLNQIREDDFLYVIENGCVVEKGHRIDLLRGPNSRFRHFVQYQGDAQITGEDFLSSPLEDVSFSSMSEKELELLCPQMSFNADPKNNTVYINSEEKLVDENSENSSYLNHHESTDRTPKLPLSKIIWCLFRDSDRKPILILGVVASLVAGVTNPIFSYTFSFLLEGIVPSPRITTHYIAKWSGIVISVAIADTLFGFLGSFLLQYCSEYWIIWLRNKAFEFISRKKYQWYFKDENNPAEISALFMNDSRDLRSLASDFLSVAATFLVVSSCGLIWATISGWKLSLVCISMFPLIVIVSGIYGSTLQKLEVDYKSSVAELENCFCEIVTEVKTIRTLQATPYFVKKYEELLMVTRRIGRRRALATGIGIATTNTMTMATQSILYYYGFRLVLNREYQTAQLLRVFVLLLFTIITCTSLVSQIPDIARGQRAATWIYRILDEPVETIEEDEEHSRSTGIETNKPVRSLISVKKLTFGYPADGPGDNHVTVFRNLSLELKANQSVAIVGQSGCGKSTLVSLLEKFYEVMPSSLYIDGTDITEWNTKALRKQFSLVEQKPLLFDRTLRENLLYGNTDRIVTDDEIFNMLKFVGVYDIIAKLPRGLDTRISSELLSGGQAQRVCIARALLRKSKILILDECTSALDPESAAIVEDIVRSNRFFVLTIVITHSRSMMKCCDKIVVLKDGLVVETGTYGQLNREGSEFSKLIATESQEK